jgi:hypothetical protein
MYPHEIDHASSKVLEIVGLDKNTFDEVKYKQLRSFLEALAAVHYSKGHDDGYSLSAGYSRK